MSDDLLANHPNLDTAKRLAFVLSRIERVAAGLPISDQEIDLLSALPTEVVDFLADFVASRARRCADSSSQ